ncbi:hypothetical protein KAR91_36390 [Candidatus Pacearchaeota archaeon]|nr:hypothetical protein [Candidatus Pacearchaeota archaeon]
MTLNFLMGTVIKVILIILAIFLVIGIAVGIYAGITIKKGLDLKKTIEAINVTQIEEDLRAIQEGDCSRLEGFENNAEELRAQVIDACENAALKKLIEKEQPGACDMANDPNSDAQQELDRLREQCNL